MLCEREEAGPHRARRRDSMSFLSKVVIEPPWRGCSLTTRVVKDALALNM